uniref:Uncharacterized protein n=1 Tax=Arion vulgaris TaxID=1028688 RepID=A0A0B6ZNX0_9EUPU
MNICMFRTVDPNKPQDDGNLDKQCPLILQPVALDLLKHQVRVGRDNSLSKQTFIDPLEGSRNCLKPSSSYWK